MSELFKSKKRVSDHGEVFTPAWMVDSMLDLVKQESERIDSRFLEPACGDGNFLVSVLRRKLATVERVYGKNEFEKKHQALFALMCIYGIELLEDNSQDCRRNLLQILSDFFGGSDIPTWRDAAKAVLELNILQGDALTLLAASGQPLVFAEWAYLGKGKYSRRDFKFDDLTQRSAFGEGTLFAGMEIHEIFEPVADYKPMSVTEIAAIGATTKEEH
jgi:hypothetical protein